MPLNSSKVMYHDAMEILICGVKVAKEAWIEPVHLQRIDHTFEFQVQAISEDKLLCILNAVVNNTITPTTDDDDDDKLSDHLDDLVKGVIEHETRALAASMTMADIFRFPDYRLHSTRSSNSMNQPAVTVFGNVQLELKYSGLLILYDAYIYVKPQFVGVVLENLSDKFMAEQEDATRTRQATEVLLNVQADQLQQAPALPSQEVEISVDDGDKQEVESIERASKTDEIMSFQCQSPEPLIPQEESLELHQPV